MNNTLDLSSMLDAASGSTPELTVTDPFTDDFPTPTAANSAALDSLDPSLMSWPLLDLEASNHSNVTDSSARTANTKNELPRTTATANDARSSSSRSESVPAAAATATTSTSTTRQPKHSGVAGVATAVEQDRAKEKLAQRKLRNKESARRYREKQVARRRQLENFTRTLAEQNRELEALHDRLLALTCERRLRAGNNTARPPAHFAQVPVQNRSALPLQ